MLCKEEFTIYSVGIVHCIGYKLSILGEQMIMIMSALFTT